MRLAVIPARGGSKRIPRKNIRLFAGKPMMGYSIEAAINSKLFDRVIVSTDDVEISAVAQDFGAEVPFTRPEALSDDHAGTTEVVAHASEWFASRGSPADEICCIYATAPFLRAEDLEEGLRLLDTGRWQYVFAATHFVGPVYRAFRRTGEGGVEMLFPQHFPSRSQDLPEVLHDAGQFYWGKSGAWMRRARVFDVHSTVVQIPRWRVQDIDTDEDWQYAEAMAVHLGLRNATPFSETEGDNARRIQD